MARLNSLLALLLISLCSLAEAAKFNRVLDIGKPAPQWGEKMLPGTDDKKYGLDSFKEAKALVLLFTCNHCPVAKAYEDRILALALKYKDAGVQFVAISVSTYEADLMPEMKKRATSKKYSFPYLQDATQTVGKAYGATNTPTVFVLDAQRKISYMGRIDDALQPEKVTERFLEAALEAVLKGEEPEIAETKPFGCEIHYEK